MSPVGGIAASRSPSFVRPPGSPHSRSAFAPRQILLGHAALSDPAVGHLLHGERIAREGLGLAQASRSDADVVLDDWHLRRLPDGRFVAHVAGQGFALDLAFSPGQPILLQGDHGFSRKGPEASSASHYYSMPHLAVSGTVTEQGQVRKASGEAWLDREWSSSYLPEGAVGWDWTGLNFADGGALMAFRIRRKDGSALWAGGTYRAPQGGVVVLRPQDIAFTVRRRWRSARTGALSGRPGVAGEPARRDARMADGAAVRRSGVGWAGCGQSGLLGGRRHRAGRARLSRTDRLCG
jgi:predicted secreted hydrolase